MMTTRERHMLWNKSVDETVVKGRRYFEKQRTKVRSMTGEETLCTENMSTTKSCAEAVGTDVRTRSRKTVARNAVSANSRAMSSCGVGVLDLLARRQTTDTVLPTKPTRHSTPINTASTTKS